jgi:hypothetical protein
MMRTRIVVMVIVAVAAAARPSEACKKRHQSLFELYDLATSVAVVKVGALPAKGAGKVELAVKNMLKGDAKKTLVAIETNTSCRTGYAAGGTAIVFLGADGRSVGLYEGYVRDVVLWQPVIESYATAGDDAARFALLATTIAGDHREPSLEAAYYLLDRPDLLAHVDKDTRAKLRELASHPAGKGGARNGIADDSMFALLLARLDMTKFDAISDPAKLADTIAAGHGPTDPERIAALERCERVRGKQLFPFTDYHRGVAETFWTKLADSCRTGAPARP